MYIPKIDDYLEILTDKEVRDFVAINFSEYFQSRREQKKNVRKVAKSLHIFLTTPNEVEKYVPTNSSHNRIHHYNVEIFSLFDSELQLKKLFKKLKKLKVQTVLVLDYEQRNEHKIFLQVLN